MFLRSTSRLARASPLFRRYATSVRPQGLSEILQKNPDDVVITYARRTAIGRAFKGQFKDIPVDELLHALFKAALAESNLDPSRIDDICVGGFFPRFQGKGHALSSGNVRNVPSPFPPLHVSSSCPRCRDPSGSAYFDGE